MRRRAFLAALASAPALSLAGRAVRAQDDVAAKISAFVELACQHWRVPGAAVAVIHQGRRILTAGFGVRSAERGERADEHTAFGIGSCSKAYTACAAALAIEEGRIGWDDPVKSVLPELKLYDREITDALSLRDLLSHRVGLSRAFVGEYGSDLSRAQVLARAAQAERKAAFREELCYSNLGFVVASEAIARAAGVPFERFVEARILQPLGMKDSTAEGRAWLARPNVAAPHRVLESRATTIPPLDLDNCMGAGSLWVSAHDAAAWLEVQLGARALVSPASLQEMHAVQVSKPDRYGLGWYIGTYRGGPFVSHNGSVRGFTSRTRVDPQAGFAVFAAVNSESIAATAIVAHVGQLLDRSPQRDWIAFYDEQRAQRVAKAASQLEQDRKADPLEPSSFAVGDFAGTYRHGGLGTVTLRERDGALRVSVQDLSLYDGWLARYAGMHFAHQMDGFRTSKDPRPAGPGDMRVRFEEKGGRIVAAEWLGAWFGPARFTRL
jgi:CubicO group peptidase (beta-lactamase class C family)